MQRKWETVPKFARQEHAGAKRQSLADAPQGAATSQRVHEHESRVTPGHSTAKSEARKYTGDKILGIATMHKSSMVPVFAASDAVDIARMRR